MSSLNRNPFSRLDEENSSAPDDLADMPCLSPFRCDGSTLMNTILIPGEDEDFFLALYQNVENQIQPESDYELFTVQTIAASRWRQYRAWLMERIVLNGEILRQLELAGPDAPPAGIAQKNGYAFQELADRGSRALSQLHRYEASLSRTINSSMKSLIAYRTALQKQQSSSKGSPRLPAQTSKIKLRF